MNEVKISGALIRAAKFNEFPSGSRVANATVKVPRGNGGDFIDAKGWDEIADALKEHGNPGNMAFITGAIHTDLYPNKQDAEKKDKSTYVQIYTLRIVDGASGATLVEVEAKKKNGGDGAASESEPAPAVTA